MKKLSIRDCDVKGKRVLARVDFNVPLDSDRIITDDTRIIESLPTVRDVVDRGGRLILMSHLGRPRGQKNPELSLAPVAARLAELVRNPLRFAHDCIGDDVKQKVAALKDGEILLLENLRFHAGEEENAPAFAKELASLGEVYVNDAFGTAHRAHASTVGVAEYIQTRAAGFLMEKELKALGEALNNPSRPFVAVLGGAKIAGKIDLIKSLLDRVDALLVGGGMMYTFFKAQIASAKTVFWNGPMGVFEKPTFAEGTKAIARAIADATDRGAKTIVGGGDSVAAINLMGIANRFTHISTGGGASLEFMEGRALPGIEALCDVAEVAG